MSAFADPRYLAEQYGSAERLRARHDVHARCSENRGHYFDWLLHFLEPLPDLLFLDVGCGHGAQHLRLRQQRMRILGVDLSAGMLRDARRQRARLRRSLVRGDARHLPLPDRSVDRIMANHMLYHVPEPEEVLRELRRVLGPEGRLVIGTNAADSGARLLELHARVAAELGYRATPPVYASFHLGHLPRVREVFPEAALHVRRDAFLFPDVDTALRYYASALVDHIEDRPADAGHRVRLLQVMASEIQKILDAEGGVFRVPKDAGCFVVKGEAL